MIVPGDLVVFQDEMRTTPMFWHHCEQWIAVDGDMQLQLRDAFTKTPGDKEKGLVIGTWRTSKNQCYVLYVYFQTMQAFGYTWDYSVDKVG